MPRHAANAPSLDKGRLLALLAEHPGATKRDLARLTGLKGSDRILLKRLLRELEAEGAIAGKAKCGLTKAGELPEIAVLEITGTDGDGEVLARKVGAEPRPDRNGNLIDHRRVLIDFDSAERWYTGLPSNVGRAA